MTSSCRFRKEDRIVKRSEFLELKRSGKSLQGLFFIAVTRKNPFNRPRLGITVTKRVGKAVTRNMIKRIVRENFRRQKSSIKRSLDINVIATHQAGNQKKEMLNASIMELFLRLQSDEENIS